MKLYELRKLNNLLLRSFHSKKSSNSVASWMFACIDLCALHKYKIMVFKQFA